MDKETQKENIEQIASSIDRHTKEEIANYLSNRAFARACCTTKSTREGVSEKIFWLTNEQNTRGLQTHRDWTGNGVSVCTSAKTTLESDGQPLYKNTKLGGILTMHYEGTHRYTTRTITKKINDIDITIHNRSIYSPCYDGAKEIEIRMAGDTNYYRFQKLSDLLNARKEDQEELRKQKEELLKLKEEQERLTILKAIAEKEAKERAEREEQERIEALKRQKEEEEKQRKIEIERLERSINETNEKIKSVKYFLRKSVVLRSQHLLDPYQETAKRSHIYDGVPIVIEGGPGTGKTTTMIQRLKFLLSREVLSQDDENDGYDSPLTKSQIEYLTEPSGFNSRWLFFSPTDLLLHYLRNNMNEEGLSATDENTRTLTRYRQKVMRDYYLFDPTKDGPFKDYKPNTGEKLLIIAPMKMISEFEKFCIEYSTKLIKQRVELKTSQYDWHLAAQRIKSICVRYANIKDIDTLMRLFNSLHDNERSNVKIIEVELKNLLNEEGIKVKQAVMKDNDMASATHALFDRWRKEKIQSNEDDEDLVDEEDEEMDSFSKQEFEALLFYQTKQLLKQIALKKIDSKIKFSKRNQELFSIIEKTITEDIAIDKIGEKSWFVRNFASLCRGIESNLIKNIPAMYKAFRRNILTIREKEGVKIESGMVYRPSDIYQDELLEKIVKKDTNKHLHPDEQNLLIGFINNMLYDINKKSKLRFQALKHKYAKAYINNVKPVIGIDEATDYSLLDYYFMVSFRHYDFSSITLCGDVMQGLNSNGIRHWKELQKSILPNLKIFPLNISYRQLPTLLEMAREMYKDDQKEYPLYQSDKEKSANEPKPLLLISNDEDEKAEWISNRILDIFNAYDKELPSVAVFVGDDVNIKEFIDRIVDLDLLNGIELADCSGNNTLQNKEMVRVFRLSEVKGMEFEAVFFYDIDRAIEGHSTELMRRFLYVGISRATSHLAATMCSDGGEDSIVKYFDTETEEW